MFAALALHEYPRCWRAEGIIAVNCDSAQLGISASIDAGIRAAPDAHAWLIALADMPWIRPRTIRALAYMLKAGAEVAAPVYRGRRGHPVGFARSFKTELLKLNGDRRARDLLMKFPARVKT